jgi:hypothetical protein
MPPASAGGMGRLRRSGSHSACDPIKAGPAAVMRGTDTSGVQQDLTELLRACIALGRATTGRSRC